MNQHSGIFITIEGTEGVGKSSAIQCLAAYCQNHHRDFVLTREPGGTEIAEIIRHIILQPHAEVMSSDTELLLMFASRAQHLANVILPALAEGKVVISDRFTDATYAYQGGGRGLDNHRIATLEQWVHADIQPNLTLLLDAPAAVGLQRILSRNTKDRIEQEHIDFFERVREAYLSRAQQYPERFKIVDATQPVEVVQETICRIIADHLAI